MPIPTPTEKRALALPLRRRRHIQRRVLGEEIHRHQAHLHDLARHDGEVLDPGDVLQAELHPDDDVGVHDAVLAVRPRPDPLPAAGLVGVLPAGVQLAVAVSGDVDVVVGELGALVVEGVRVGEHFLEVWRVDLVRDRFAVDGVDGVRVGDLVGQVGGLVEVQAAGVGDLALADGVAHAVRVEVGFLHGEGFGGEDAVSVAVDGGVDAEGEDVLVVGGQDAGVDDGAPGDGEASVDGLGGDDAGGADLVGQLAGLVEDEGEDVLVVGDCDDGLEHQFAGAGDGGGAGAVVGVFPADAGVLFVDADDVFHGQGGAFVVREEAVEVVDGAQTVAAEGEVVGHDAGAGVAEVEGGFAVERGAGVSVGDVHVGEGEAVEQGAAVVADLRW